MRTTQRLAVMTWVVVRALLITSTASAVYRKSTLSGSYADNGTWNKVTVCDLTADGDTTYSDFETKGGVGDRIYDPDYKGNCRQTEGFSSGLRVFNVCFDRVAAGDPCGDWVYP